MSKALENYLNNDAAAGEVMAHVANFKNGILIIHTDNCAVASKLRQLGQRLSREIAESGIECAGRLSANNQFF